MSDLVKTLEEMHEYLRSLPPIPDRYVIILEFGDIGQDWIAYHASSILEWLECNPGLEDGDFKIYAVTNPPLVFPRFPEPKLSEWESDWNRSWGIWPGKYGL